MTSMQTVILAGGLGTRIRAVEPNLPKSLIPVGGKPFIEHQFDLLARHGLRHVLLCIGHKGERIREHVGDGTALGMEVKYSVEDPYELMGTGGALVNALPELNPEFLVMYGDSYLPTDYSAVVDTFVEGDLGALMCVFHNKGQWDQSNVRTDGSKVTFYSKSAAEGEADYIDYGLSAFKRYVVEKYLGAPRPLDLADIMSDLVKQGKLGAFEVKERFYEIGKPEGLDELNELLGKAE